MPRVGGKDRGLFFRPHPRGSRVTLVRGQKVRGEWWICWVCPYGHTHREKVGAKDVARDLHQRRRQQVKADDFCLTRARQLQAAPALFRDAKVRYEAWAEIHRPRSLTFRKKALKHLAEDFGAKLLSELTTADVEAYVRRRRDGGAAPATVNRERSVLSHLCTKAISWRLAETNPVAATERQPEPSEAPRPLTPDEESRLLICLPKGKRAWPHWKALVTLALHTGLRLDELRAQRWADVDLPARALRVSAPKSGRPEAIPLNATARAVLAGLERTGPLVFPGLPARVSDMFGKIAARANLSDVTFHCLRDTFISRLAPHVTTPSLMALARHRDYRTTRRYVSVDEAHLRAAVARLDPEVTRTSTRTDVRQRRQLVEKTGGSRVDQGASHTPPPLFPPSRDTTSGWHVTCLLCAAIREGDPGAAGGLHSRDAPGLGPARFLRAEHRWRRRSERWGPAKDALMECRAGSPPASATCRRCPARRQLDHTTDTLIGRVQA